MGSDLTGPLERLRDDLRTVRLELKVPGTEEARRARDDLAAQVDDYILPGVPTVVRAVGDAHRRRGALATGWPFVRWLRRFRPDPLKRLRLPESPQPQVRTSLSPPTDVQRAQVASAARRLADGATEGLPQPWPRLARQAATAADDRSPTASTVPSPAPI